ncbi:MULTISPECIES: BMP family ABC transporter substrate-binding protein [unclassified Polaromonas]|uniref:BMP family ABC transporter substrate-binding protein n=1 Tax=unclassified Polaromonas TaxID=2638319 RepID=UPI0018C92FD6|nr:MULTISPECIES: BMP family ABC transporter substrate-binding protein [unclassified Polaromonas]MBG6070405.1 simple sugar transport system substrate-binding protein [Polaromonas sp. CG_9.7]MBG6112403.1 simple sugar transport system substrate-binding protein [Polaromonas sp. CG_9.2]MDH6184050.1 simple sugar transport system substrate-binding protein [Polaromonas sp. CG_23.6]
MYKNLVATLVAACFVSPVFSQAPTPPKPLKIGFVYVTPVTDAGWVHQHDEARKAVEVALGDQVKTTFVENVPEGADAERVIRDLARQGNQLIFTPSFGYMEPTLKVAKDFPDVKFESITGYTTAPNVAVANARYYEGRYLAGIAAGRLATSAGYVAGFAIPEVIQGINAFTLGMRSVNPKATVKVVWLGAWFDPPREREAAMTLFNQGVEVMAFHTGSTAVMRAAQERGKLAIAYHSDMRQVAPDAQVLAVTHQWGDYYTRRAQAVLSGSWESAALWGGVKEGMIRVDSFGPKVSQKVADEVLARQRDIAAGRLHPFKARAALLDNQGHEVLAAGKTLNDAQILNMNFLVQGVQGKLN